MWISRTIFIFPLLLQVSAIYFVIQHRRINTNNIIEDVPSLTIASCQMKCTNTQKCVAIGFKNDPHLEVNNRCCLIRNVEMEDNEEDALMLFVLVSVSI